MEKILLTDADGVLFNWEYAFHTWMRFNEYLVLDDSHHVYDLSKKYGLSKTQSRELVREFNHLPSIGFLPALRDAEFYVKKLASEGWKFHVITSLAKTPSACELRTQNLKKLFGENTFDRFVYLDTGEDKDVALSEYKNSGLYWIEDKIENAEAGLAAGLKPILIEHGHNMHYTNSNIVIKKNWGEVYDYINIRETSAS